MGWVCRICSTNNDDSSDTCFVCGAKREECETGTVEEDIAHEGIEAGSEAIEFVTEKRSLFVKVISVLFPILAFAIGQVLLYVLFAKEGKALFLTRFIKASGNYEFNVLLFLLITSIAGGISCILAVCNNLSLAARGKEFRVYWSTLPYCTAMVLCPHMSACWLLVLEFIGVFIRKRQAFIAIITLANLFVLITIVILPSVAEMIGETYTITFDTQGGVGGSTRTEAKVEHEMPFAEAPIKEGYIFEGYYDSISGGVQYYNSDMESVRNWDVREDSTLYAHWTAGTFIVELDRQGGSGGTYRVEVSYNALMPQATAPFRTGYTFLGYYDDLWAGVQYYDDNMGSSRKWDKPYGGTLYARWRANTYLVILDLQGGNGTSQVTVTYGEQMPEVEKPTKEGFEFYGFYSERNGIGTQYYDAEMKSTSTWTLAEEGTLYAYWKSALLASVATSSLTGISDSKSTTIIVSNGSGSYSYRTSSSSYSGVSVSFSDNRVTLTKTGHSCSGTVVILVSDIKTGAEASCSIYYTTTAAPSSCVAPGTLITLADGTQKPVENLKGDESILVWNFYTGRYEGMPLLFIEKVEQKEHAVIDLYFSDGSRTKAVIQHCYWSFDEGGFVNINEYNADSYVGQWFGKLDYASELGYQKVQLIRAEVYTENIASYNPVAYGNLSFFANGILSAAAAAEPFVNMFEVKPQTLCYNQVEMERDIAQYGLYTYSDFAEYLPEAFYTAFHLEYLKISVEKGIVTWDALIDYIGKLPGMMGGKP